MDTSSAKDRAVRMEELRPASLADIASGGAYLALGGADLQTTESQRLDLHRIDFDRCDWRNIRVKYVDVTEGSLTRCRFSDVYMPYARFVRCDLTGSEFRNCDLRKATFEDTRLWYVRFYNCELNYSALIANAPAEVNLRRRFFHALRLNALGRREHQQANRLLLLEMEATRLEHKHIFMAADDYFQRNFRRADRVRSFGTWLLLGIESAVWGYGVRLRSLLRTVLAAILLFAILIWLTDAQFSTGPTDTAPEAMGFWRSVYISAVGFTTLGGPIPLTPIARAFAVLESALGAVFLGLFAAAAFRRVER